MKNAPRTVAVRLQPYDNFDSLWDRLNQLTLSADCPDRILLVFSPRGENLREPLEFAEIRSRLLRRDVEFAVITQNPNVRHPAETAGVSVFNSRDESSASEWERKDVRKQAHLPRARADRLADLRDNIRLAESRPIPKKWEALVCLALILFVLSGLILFIPRAEVRVTPLYTEQSSSYTLWTDETLDSPVLTGGIPSRVERITKSFEVHVPATGTLQGDPSIAAGRIKITNRCTAVKSETAGTILTAALENGSIHCRLLEDVRLDPEQTLSFHAEAVEAGSAGNLPAGTVFQIDSPNSECLEIQLVEPMKGGSDGIYATPCEADYQLAAGQILEKAKENALNTLKAREKDKVFIVRFPESAEISDEAVIPEYGYASDDLTLQQTAEIGIRVTDTREMEQLIRSMMEWETPSESSTQLSYTVTEEPRESDGRIVWTISASRMIYEEKTNTEAVRIMLHGKALDEAQTILNEMVPEGSGTISVFPSFWKHMPLLQSNISVKIIPEKPVE